MADDAIAAKPIGGSLSATDLNGVRARAFRAPQNDSGAGRRSLQGDAPGLTEIEAGSTTSPFKYTPRWKESFYEPYRTSGRGGFCAVRRLRVRAWSHGRRIKH